MPVSTLALNQAVNHAKICAMMASDALERVQRIHDLLLGVHGNDGLLATVPGMTSETAYATAQKIARTSVSDDEYQNISNYLAADAIAHGPWVLRQDDHIGAEYAELLDMQPIVDDTWSEDVDDWSLLALMLTARGPGLAQQYTGVPAVHRAQKEAIAKIAAQFGVDEDEVINAIK